jgi:hypothetical protein
LCLMFGFVLVLITIFSVIDVTLQKVETLPSCIGAWRNIWTKITINHLCAPPPIPDYSNHQGEERFLHGNFK